MTKKLTKQKRIEAQISEAAERYIEAGLPLVLLGTDRLPHYMGWDEGGTSLEEIERVSRYTYDDFKNRLPGIVTGIDGLECIEVDSLAHVQDFMMKLERDMPTVYARVVRQRTRSGGGQIVYRIEGEVPGSQKLAFVRKSVPNAGWYNLSRDGETELADMETDGAPTWRRFFIFTKTVYEFASVQPNQKECDSCFFLFGPFLLRLLHESPVVQQAPELQLCCHVVLLYF